MPDSDRILRLPELREIVPLCTASIYKQMRAGTFPQPVRLTARARGWRLSDIQNWMSQLAHVDG